VRSKRELTRTRTLNTDVLVIGSGMAGVRAALEAKRANLDVLLVDKSLLGRASSSIYAGGLGLEILPPHLKYHGAGSGKYAKYWNGTIEELFIKTLEEGVSIGWGYPYIDNQRMLMMIVTQYALRQEELRDFGVKDPYSQHFIGPPGIWGKYILLPMIDYLKKQKAKTLERTVILELIEHEGHILGALAFRLDTGEFLVIRSKATVMATGGCAQIYRLTYSPTRITGDGYAIAYRAGAELWEMEMVGFENWFLNEPGVPKWWIPFSFARGSGVLRNAKGEAFFPKYAKEYKCMGENATLSFDDVMDVRYDRPLTELDHYFWRASSTEIREGRGQDGCVFLDLTKVPEERFYMETDAIFALNEMRNFDWKKKPIRISPGAEKQGGGIHINERCETGLKGLFAAGEAGTGMSMPFCIVTGSMAGRWAVQYAIEDGKIADLKHKKAWINERRETLETILKRKPSKRGNPRDIKSLVKSTMMDNVGPLRSKESLTKALRTLEKIREENLPHIYARSLRELREAIEAANMVTTGEMVARSSLYRTESRGMHQRVDYPKRDDKNWIRKVLIKKEKDEMKVFDQPVELIWARPE